ncbi:MAG: hypothetical protein JWO46_881 [Nocardioidaceae bacterium]|nr:hypothetical protein [Nocardioidaceae bacterium]
MPGPADRSHDGDPDLELTPEAELRIQALLADLRHTAATPDDVVARLDATLAGLRDEPLVAAPTPRRPWGRRLVLAAAGIAAVALVATPIVRSATDSSSTSSVAGSSADSAPAPKGDGSAPLATERSNAPDTDGLVALHSNSFATDVEHQYAALSRTATRDTGVDACAGPTPSRPLLFSRTVLLDGAPVRLDVSEGPAGSTRAVAYSCDGSTVVSRARIVAPTDGNSHGPSPRE